MSARVLIHVQHLLGTGHLRRAAAIAAALAAAGFKTWLVSGGTRLPDLDHGDAAFVQLPPARAADARFKTLVTPDGTPLDDTWRDARRRLLLEIHRRIAPDVLIIEHFPFGRRLLEFELLPLIETARAQSRPPLMLCSLRDVLTIKRDPRKIERMMTRARELFDRVLVHGDPNLLPLTVSLPESADLADRVAYTGYVHARGTATPPGEDGRNEIIVSAGGGDVGLKLFETALELRGESRWRNRFWRVLAAGTDIPPRREPGLVVEPNRPDFQGLLARARLSVSQAGYNTVVDLLSSRTRSVLVPFAAEAETEQLVRAGALEARGLARTVLAPRLSAANLGAAIEAVEDVPPPRHRVDLEGATKTTKLVREWLG